MARNSGGVNVPVTATWNGKALKQAESQLSGFKKGFGKAFLGFGAAAGAAVGISAITDQLAAMATAAAEDQKSVVSLQKAMQNVGLGPATQQAEDFTRSLMLATGQSDELIRNGLQRLITATGDYQKAQDGVSLAMDISAATGKDLSSVTAALAKAYSGSATGLARLGVGLDKALLKSGDMVKITEVLNQKFGGQAAAAAATYSGKLLRVSTAAKEAQETVGYQLLGALDNVSGQLGGANGFIDLITSAGDGLAAFVAGAGKATTETVSLGKALMAAVPGVDESNTSFGDILITLGKLTPGINGFVFQTEALVKSGEEEIRTQNELNAEIQRAATMREIYSGKIQSSTSATEADTAAGQRNLTITEKLIRAQERLNGGNRSMISANLRIRQLRREGPQSSGGKNGKVVTKDDRLTFGLDYAGAVSDKYDLLIGQKKFKAAQRVLSSGRDYLSNKVGDTFADRVLGTPKSLNREINRRDSQRGANEWRSNQRTVINNFNFGDLKVASPQEAVRQARQAARLAALSRGLGNNDQGAVPMPTTGWGQIK